MKKKNAGFFALAVSTGLIGVTVVLLAGCASTGPAGSTVATASAGADTGKGGSQLWGENCGRCHNIRFPSSYSDVEWQVAMHHMRIRANLTAEEYKKILEFLKSAN